MDSTSLTTAPRDHRGIGNTMATVNLTFKTVTAPDFGGFMFFVEEGTLFEADDYADAYGLNRSDIDAQDVHAAQDAAGRLNPGEWLQVEHSVGE